MTVTYTLNGVGVNGADAATPGSDYVDPGAGSVSWDPLTVPKDKKTVTKFVSIPIIGDTTAENIETFQLSLVASPGYGLDHGTTTAMILPDDPPTAGPGLSIGDASTIVGIGKDGTISMPITLSGPVRR